MSLITTLCAFLLYFVKVEYFDSVRDIHSISPQFSPIPNDNKNAYN